MPRDQKEKRRDGQNETKVQNGEKLKEVKLQGALKYRVERDYTGTRSFDEVVARICRVYRNKERNLNE